MLTTSSVWTSAAGPRLRHPSCLEEIRYIKGSKDGIEWLMSGYMMILCADVESFESEEGVWGDLGV